MPVDIGSPTVGPYCGVFVDRIRNGDRKLRILAYRAYNAYGLIGSEYNGIAILDETDKCVLTDGLFGMQSGYDLKANRYEELVQELIDMPEQEIKDLILDSPRSRYARA